ncbi:MAG TPA: Ada metal-binding domain-containing protein [Verrucomicrobiae bacterium]|nr:Ada metal-binding domain-containing protein [Verrucomicrobiae bacterium]
MVLENISPNGESAVAAPWNGSARRPRLTAAKMYAALLAGDPQYNGRFFTGVLTTGIYCLPSCKARKPKQTNVRFFPTVEAARAAGLRPCRKCHPDDFARGADPVLESIETLVGEIRSNPASFLDAQAVVRRSGFGATRLFELFRQHYHTTPGDLLLRARIDTAKQLLLAGGATLASVAYDAGFDALSSFHENFRRLNGLTPTAFRELPGASEFEIALPNGYPLPYLRRALIRDQQSVSERLEGNCYSTAVHLAGQSAILTMRLNETSVTAEFPRGTGVEAHQLIVRLLGLDQDAAGFARLSKRLGVARLTAGRPELRIIQTHSVFDGLLWSVIGQQIGFSFACLLRRRLIERAGEPVGNGLYAPPTPTAVAALTRTDLLQLQFSRQKADYVLGIARLVGEGKLDLEALRAGSATRVEQTLLGVRGLGPWAVNYLMMRSLGFADCVPLGDTGVASGLQSLFKLEERPDIDSMRRLMTVFAPFRSLATAHLWQFNQPIPL